MSNWAEQKAKRMLMPWDEDTPDAKGFWNYVRDHYQRCLEKAWFIACAHGDSEEAIHLKANIVFDKLASPLVYLWELWTVMSPEKKVKYNLELAKIHEEVRKQVEEAFKK